MYKNYKKMSQRELRENYWKLRIEISKIVLKYKIPEQEILNNPELVDFADREKLSFLFWEIVKCLNYYNFKKNSRVCSVDGNVIRVNFLKKEHSDGCTKEKKS